ncbi:MAG: hypothetical protein WC503_03710 [Candidatus Shapirobacteria bacterium]
MVDDTSNNHPYYIRSHDNIFPNIAYFLVRLHAFLNSIVNQKIIRTLRIFGLIIFTLIICFCTYQLCYFIAEKYFFDKIFYQKSTAHGYIIQNQKKETIIDYGDRNNDLQNINNFQNINTIDNVYIIDIIGDSYVWGQGIKNNQRFSSLLSKKLNKIRPTKIISLGKIGWNILDYLKTYQDLTKTTNPHLTIFSLVENDVLVNKHDNLSSTFKECVSNTGDTSPPLYDDAILSENNINDSKNYESFIVNAWLNPVNICIVNRSLSLLPKNKSIYFITTDYFGNNILYKKYRELLTEQNKYIISTDINKNNLSKYSKYYKNVQEKFLISSKEGHPNALANQMYADILYNEITTNPQWGFTK